MDNNIPTYNILLWKTYIFRETATAIAALAVEAIWLCWQAIHYGERGLTNEVQADWGTERQAAVSLKPVGCFVPTNRQARDGRDYGYRQLYNKLVSQVSASSNCSVLTSGGWFACACVNTLQAAFSEND